jgi:hypothetical protein
MGALRHHRALVACIAIVALLCNLATAFSSLAFAQRPASDYPTELLGPLLICTEHGAPIAVPEGGEAPEAPPNHCPMCLAPPTLLFILVAAESHRLLPLATRQRSAVPFSAALLDWHRRAGLDIRAPPLPA